MRESESKNLLNYVQDKSGQNILACYHCKKCTAGCPVASFMDIQPNAINRMIQYNRRKEVLRSSTIWLCAGCEACGARCPNDIDIAKVADSLKQLMLKEGISSKEKQIPVMHKVFVSGIQKRGRMHEVSLIRDMRMRSGGYFKDMGLAFKMFRMGKLTILPEKVKNIKEVKKLFKKVKRDR